MIQVLRGVAALMVVSLHTTMMQHDRLGSPLRPWLSGGAGVDLFFVISGFVMSISARSVREAIHPMRTFLLRRVERVVPLYWLATTAKLALALLFPLAGASVFGGVWHVVASYLFIPSVGPQGVVHPVLIVGWTLNLEMFFYLIVAIGLGLQLRLVPYLTAALLALGAASFLRGPGTPVFFYLADPLLWEFLFGVLLARFGQQLDATRAWQKVLCASSIVLGFAVMMGTPDLNGMTIRVLLWGVPALLIVGSAIALERTFGSRIPGWILELGDASYSIYLTHTMVLAGLGWIGLRYRGLGPWGWRVEGCAFLIFSVLVSEMVYRWVERPIVRYFHGRRRLL